MHQLIIVLMSIVLTAVMITVTAVYTPASKTTTEVTYALVKDGFHTFDKAYQLYTKANNGAAPAVAAAADGGLSASFSDFLPFPPKAPVGFAWKYGYSSAQSRHYFCLYSDSGGTASIGMLTAFNRAQKIYSDSQYVLHAGGASNCGSTVSVDTATSANVAMTYFVQNTETFSPKSIPGLALWLDADDSGSIAQSGASVTQWLDKSGNGNNATQSSGSYMPSYNSTGFRGKGGISFARAALDYMEVPLSPSLNFSAFDAFVVGSLNPSGYGSALLSSSADGTCNANCSNYSLHQSDQGGAYPVDNGIQMSIAGGGITVNVEPSVSTTALNVSAAWEGMYNAGTIATAQNLATGSVSSGVTMDTPSFNLQIGRGTAGSANEYLDGTVGEIVVYNRALTSLERRRLQHYFGRKWAIGSLTD